MVEYLLNNLNSFRANLTKNNIKQFFQSYVYDFKNEPIFEFIAAMKTPYNRAMKRQARHFLSQQSGISLL